MLNETTHFNPDSSATTPIAVAAAQAATMFGISRAQWWKLHAMGKVPMPIYLGTKAPRWRVDELRAWVAAGAPDRQTWERTKDSVK
jgi:predicted DNA-binding transcriptional regulator AlpA